MYENRRQAPLTHRHFVGRVVSHLGFSALLIVASIGVGMLGYRYFERLPWIDAFLNSAMLLGGMGPVNMPVTAGGKLFAGVYALYSGLVFIVTAALMFSPILHRVLHRFHWPD
ncbi:hypothetical protein C7S18_01135 [Ahniella affigens]|uniref:Two pore domain potassium channel family protein n=1 Tax=Ahniella affigens TaxID=2021234 RepID=A0A2P1PM24_9GAMM|nr:hypothetical protein [Ahniella affigens]AVP95886.1 hypothetical protein C7S18_01135 [Ahniella affigens]